MYPYLLLFHSLVRWLVLASLLFALYRSFKGWLSKSAFGAMDGKARQWAVTMAHTQLVIGYVLYFSSPIIAWFRTHYHEAIQQPEFRFFGLVHIIMMTLAVTCITIGGAAARRKGNDTDKFKIMATWFTLALVIIFLAIPWPFSPLAKRPLFRIF